MKALKHWLASKGVATGLFDSQRTAGRVGKIGKMSFEDQPEALNSWRDFLKGNVEKYKKFGDQKKSDEWAKMLGGFDREAEPLNRRLWERFIDSFKDKDITLKRY